MRGEFAMMLQKPHHLDAAWEDGERENDPYEFQRGGNRMMKIIRGEAV